MRATTVLQATWTRIRRPITWGAILAFGLLWNGVRWGLGVPAREGQDILAPFLWATLFMALSPLPWQWTGDDQPLARSWRGIFQAVPWNAFWVLLLLFALSDPPRPAGPPRSPETGMSRGTGQGMGRGHGAGRMRQAPPEPPIRVPLHPRVLFFASLYLSFGTLLGWILADKERAETEGEKAKQAAAQAQARALQAQMNPHVLFNALSGLTELVHEDAHAAEEALVSLAGLLRTLLELGQRPTCSLAVERGLVEQYLAVEAFRLGKRLQVSWEWDRSLEHRELPPLLLQPLVENALKHGIAPSRTGGELRIALVAVDGGLELQVANTGHPMDENAAEGVGLSNLRERLSLLGFGPEAFRLEHAGGWTRAILRLPGDKR